MGRVSTGRIHLAGSALLLAPRGGCRRNVNGPLNQASRAGAVSGEDERLTKEAFWLAKLSATVQKLWHAKQRSLLEILDKLTFFSPLINYHPVAMMDPLLGIARAHTHYGWTYLSPIYDLHVRRLAVAGGS
jgi:hypothetical protein